MLILNDYVGVVEEYAYRSAEVLDKIDSSEIEACFPDEIFHPKKKNRPNFWMPGFGWVRIVSG
jgi:hypothetical protein